VSAKDEGEITAAMTAGGHYDPRNSGAMKGYTAKRIWAICQVWMSVTLAIDASSARAAT